MTQAEETEYQAKIKKQRKKLKKAEGETTIYAILFWTMFALFTVLLMGRTSGG